MKKALAYYTLGLVQSKMGELTIVFIAVSKEGSRRTVTMRDPPLPLPNLDRCRLTVRSVQAMEMYPLQSSPDAKPASFVPDATSASSGVNNTRQRIYRSLCVITLMRRTFMRLWSADVTSSSTVSTCTRVSGQSFG